VTTAICCNCWLSSKSRVMEKEQCCAPFGRMDHISERLHGPYPILFLQPFLTIQV
jgi:hypothetical protein